MFDHAGQPLREARLSEAVQIIGWRELPNAGDEILEVENEHRANMVLRFRKSKHNESLLKEQAVEISKKQVAHQIVCTFTLRINRNKVLSISKVIAILFFVFTLTQEYKEQLERRRSLGRYRKLREPRSKETQPDDGVPRLNVIIKADVAGTAEAILDVFDTYGDDERCHFDVVHYGIGPPTESEVNLAQAFDGN